MSGVGGDDDKKGELGESSKSESDREGEGVISQQGRRQSSECREREREALAEHTFIRSQRREEPNNTLLDQSYAMRRVIATRAWACERERELLLEGKERPQQNGKDQPKDEEDDEADGNVLAHVDRPARERVGVGGPQRVVGLEVEDGQQLAVDRGAARDGDDERLGGVGVDLEGARGDSKVQRILTGDRGRDYERRGTAVVEGDGGGMRIVRVWRAVTKVQRAVRGRGGEDRRSVEHGGRDVVLRARDGGIVGGEGEGVAGGARGGGGQQHEDGRGGVGGHDRRRDLRAPRSAGRAERRAGDRERRVGGILHRDRGDCRIADVSVGDSQRARGWRDDECGRAEAQQRQGRQQGERHRVVSSSGHCCCQAERDRWRTHTHKRTSRTIEGGKRARERESTRDTRREVDLLCRWLW